MLSRALVGKELSRALGGRIDRLEDVGITVGMAVCLVGRYSHLKLISPIASSRARDGVG